MLRVTRSTTLVFITWSTSIQKIGANSFQTRHQQNKTGQSVARRDVAHSARRPSPAARSRPRHPRPCLPRPRAAQDSPCLRSLAPQRVPAPRRVVSAPARRRTREPRAAVARRASPPSPLVTHRRRKPPIKAPHRPPARHLEPPRRHCCRRPELVLPPALAAGQLLR
jgi:hypothetical protein